MRMPGEDESPSLLRSVVKVLTVSDTPDYEQPWQTMGAEPSVGSGAIVKTPRGLRVLTNAHVVENHVFVEVRRYGEAHKFVATVEGVGHVCDLALLDVADPRFFEGTSPIEIGDLPNLTDRVSVLGYPMGGDRLSVTEGIVSRIEMNAYTQTHRSLLTIQIDAAINEGNSGGPVVRDGKLVGVAFQALDEGQNIGYMIASPVVRHFLDDMATGTFDGFPALGINVQSLDSQAHRASLGLRPDSYDGLLINSVVFEGSAWGVLEAGDVLMAVDNVQIMSDGSVRLRDDERIRWTYVVTRRQVGETLPVRIWRDGAMIDVELTLQPPQFLVAEDAYDVKPTYFLHGGLLFVPLSRDFLKTWGDDWWTSAPGHLLAYFEYGVRSPQRTQVVVLQKVLADQVTQGYSDFESLVIDSVEGVEIR
ncbi:MAG: trypsin-like peptidase domain-containing protein, partial [Deltaproteobacteria bacterium]|nr:trypsin-like peptidase domain-containing protein [Deltaproteobacteria bacterium]